MIEQPHNVPIDGRPHGLSRDQAYMLSHDYSRNWFYNGDEYRIFVPEGFIYDGASVPRVAWSLTGLRPDGLIRAAALIHDWLYVHKGHLPDGSWQVKRNGVWVDVGTVWKRRHADRMFASTMREAGMARIDYRAAYKAVRLGGSLAWYT